jgi:GNAT superfamily N-acetyltransferase
MFDDNFLPLLEYHREDFLISTDPLKVDLNMVHNYLAHESYWASGVLIEIVSRSIQHSLCYGVYKCSPTNEAQIGFARVISDFSTFAYLADVFILPAYQGQGLGKWLISCILAHPELENIRKWSLHTKDAHKLYQQFGFMVGSNPETYMVYYPQRYRSIDLQ